MYLIIYEHTYNIYPLSMKVLMIMYKYVGRCLSRTSLQHCSRLWIRPIKVNIQHVFLRFSIFCFQWLGKTFYLSYFLRWPMVLSFLMKMLLNTNQELFFSSRHSKDMAGLYVIIFLSLLRDSKIMWLDWTNMDLTNNWFSACHIVLQLLSKKFWSGINCKLQINMEWFIGSTTFVWFAIWMEIYNLYSK